MAASPIYKVMFMNQGQMYEVYARRVTHGQLFGFIEIEELEFGTRTELPHRQLAFTVDIDFAFFMQKNNFGARCRHQSLVVTKSHLEALNLH